MKRSKILSLLLAVVMICMAMVSCVDSTPKVKVNATFSVVINGEAVVDSHTLELEGTTESAPSVLEAICDVMEGYGMIPEYTEESLTAVMYDGVNYAADGGNAWFFTINDKDGSRAGSTILSEGDVIVYTYGSFN